MSKQSEAKQKQNYCDKPIPRICANCIYLKQNFFHYTYTGERVEGENPDTSRFTHSDKLRCKIGSFAIKKTATCDFFEIGKNNENP